MFSHKQMSPFQPLIVVHITHACIACFFFPVSSQILMFKYNTYTARDASHLPDLIYTGKKRLLSRCHSLSNGLSVLRSTVLDQILSTSSGSPKWILLHNSNFSISHGVLSSTCVWRPRLWLPLLSRTCRDICCKTFCLSALTDFLLILLLALNLIRHARLPRRFRI